MTGDANDEQRRLCREWTGEIKMAALSRPHTLCMTPRSKGAALEPEWNPRDRRHAAEFRDVVDNVGSAGRIRIYDQPVNR